MHRFFTLFSLLLAGFGLWSVPGRAAEAISDPSHRHQLESVMQEAGKLEDKNLNRFAMEALFRYGKLYDSLYQEEKKDTLNRIAIAFRIESASRKSLADSLSAQASRAEQAKESLREKYMRLLRKSIIALVIWLAIVIVIIVFRTKTMRRNRKWLASSEASLDGYSRRFKDGEHMLDTGNLLHPVQAGIEANLEALRSLQDEVKQQVKSGALDATAFREFQSRLAEIAVLQEKQDSILAAIRGQDEADPEGRVEIDLNELCRHYLDLASGGMANPDFDCRITTDFEKRLPRIKAFPQALGNLLNHLFSNAFESMQARSAKGDKTYKPALAVSTRVLPRFIQVRIKDNGTGIPDIEMENVFNYFYTLNPPAQGAGIGLSEARRIMKDLHNGELVIESDPERGTDVYLKFYTSNEKA